MSPGINKPSAVLLFLILLYFTFMPYVYAQDDNYSLRLSLQTMINRADSLVKAMQLDSAYVLCNLALEKGRKEFGESDTTTASALYVLGKIYYAQTNYDQSEILHNKALSIREKLLGPDHPDVALSLHGLGLAYRYLGKYVEMESLFRRALEICEKALGPEHPETARSLDNLGMLCWTQGRFIEAEPYYKKALNIWEKTLGSYHPDVAICLKNLGYLYKVQGRFTEAEPLLKRSLEILKNTFGPDHPYVASILLDLAKIYCYSGNYDLSLQHYIKLQKSRRNFIEYAFSSASEDQKMRYDERTITHNTQPSVASNKTSSAIVPSDFNWMSWDITEDVRAFVDGRAANYGWKIMDENYWGGFNIPTLMDYIMPENPLLRSGIVLAGANRLLNRDDKTACQTEDGILTAFEVSGLNLVSTELVTLSACETGVGQIEGGEGVYGLRRAFQHAGAETIIMSMWTVPDMETCNLMDDFYKNWLGGQTKQDAMRQAALNVMHERRNNDKYKAAHPYFWGGFVMVGNPR